VGFTEDPALDGALCVVRGANADGYEWAVVGLYAPNMKVGTPKRDGSKMNVKGALQLLMNRMGKFAG